MPIQDVLTKSFLASSGAVLAITAKLYSTFGTARLLDEGDEHFLISNRLLLVGADAGEIASTAPGKAKRPLRVALILVSF